MTFRDAVKDDATISVVDLLPLQHCKRPTRDGDVVVAELSSYAEGRNSDCTFMIVNNFCLLEAEQFLRERFGNVIEQVKPHDRKAIQRFTIGNHNVKPLNKVNYTRSRGHKALSCVFPQGLTGMCKGTKRRIGIPIMGTHIYYQVTLVEILQQSATPIVPQSCVKHEL